MEIRELKEYSTEAYLQIAPLIKQLSERCVFTEEKLRNTIECSTCHLYVIVDDDFKKAIIGCATLCIFYSPTATKASVEDVVVSTEYRGQHLGKRLMEHVLQEANMCAPLELHLTSNPMRVAANNLYQSLGFECKETNAYQMNIN